MLFYCTFPCCAVAATPTLQQIGHDLSVTLSNGTHGRLGGVVAITKNTPLPPDWRNAPIIIETMGHNRYGETLVWLTRASDGISLNEALVRSGAAMPYARTDALVQRTRHLAVPPQAQFTDQKANDAVKQFAEIRGRIRSVTLRRDRAYLNFSEDWKTDFTIHLPRQTLRQFDEQALLALEGKEVAVRGWVHSYYGPRITLFHPAMMEMIDEPIQ